MTPKLPSILIDSYEEGDSRNSAADLGGTSSVTGTSTTSTGGAISTTAVHTCSAQLSVASSGASFGGDAG